VGQLGYVDYVDRKTRWVGPEVRRIYERTCTVNVNDIEEKYRGGKLFLQYIPNIQKILKRFFALLLPSPTSLL
jgi:hypothetical protein